MQMHVHPERWIIRRSIIGLSCETGQGRFTTQFTRRGGGGESVGRKKEKMSAHSQIDIVSQFTQNALVLYLIIQ